MSVMGNIHSIETCGTVDGPGIRFILFTQGCPLRCKFCHNPDTWKLNDGKEMSSMEVFRQVKKYKSYMKFSGGGITISGGEPLLQPEFVKDVFKRCQKEGIHTALDTSGYVDIEKAKEVLEYVDLVLLDIKSFDAETYKNVTGVSNEPTLKLAKHLSDIDKPIWLRFVLVPNLTDNPENIEQLAQFVSTLGNVERIDILPFHKMGEYKWEELGYEYALKDTHEPSSKEVAKAEKIFAKYGLSELIKTKKAG